MKTEGMQMQGLEGARQRLAAGEHGRCRGTGCGAPADATGLCRGCTSALCARLVAQFAHFNAAALAPLAWYRQAAGGALSLGQAALLKTVVLAEWHPLHQMNRLDAAQVAALMDRRPVAALRDFGRADVADAPAQRARRGAFFSALPRRPADAPGARLAPPQAVLQGLRRAARRRDRARHRRLQLAVGLLGLAAVVWGWMR